MALKQKILKLSNLRQCSILASASPAAKSVSWWSTKSQFRQAVPYAPPLPFAFNLRFQSSSTTTKMRLHGCPAVGPWTGPRNASAHPLSVTTAFPGPALLGLLHPHSFHTLRPLFAVLPDHTGAVQSRAGGSRRPVGPSAVARETELSETLWEESNRRGSSRIRQASRLGFATAPNRAARPPQQEPQQQRWRTDELDDEPPRERAPRREVQGRPRSRDADEGDVGTRRPSSGRSSGSTNIGGRFGSNRGENRSSASRREDGWEEDRGTDRMRRSGGKGSDRRDAYGEDGGAERTSSSWGRRGSGARRDADEGHTRSDLRNGRDARVSSRAAIGGSSARSSPRSATAPSRAHGSSSNAAAPAAAAVANAAAATAVAATSSAKAAALPSSTQQQQQEQQQQQREQQPSGGGLVSLPEGVYPTFVPRNPGIQDGEWNARDLQMVKRANEDADAVVRAARPDQLGFAVLGSELSDLEALVARYGQPRFRAKQLMDGVLGGARSVEDINNIPRDWRSQLVADGVRTGRSVLHHSVGDEDGTRKFLMQLHDGRIIETVGIPTEDRLTVCVSSQVGCPMRCTFCATGKGGFARNLAPHEIVDQVLIVQEKFDRRVSNVVFMGMGEPLLNLPSVLRAYHVLNKQLRIGGPYITISTVGVPNAIARLANAPTKATLAVSLHAPNQELRERIIPSAKAYPLQALMKDCAHFFKTTGRRITFEYTLLSGVNDELAHAKELVDLLHRYSLHSHVNLIPWNPVDESEFQRSSRNRVYAFQRTVEAAGIDCSIRETRGLEAAAACGQLRNQFQKQPLPSFEMPR